MAILPAAVLVSGGGDVPDDLFDGRTAVERDALLAGFIAEAVALMGGKLAGANADRAATLYAEGRAFRLKYTEVAFAPQTVTTPDSGGHGYGGAAQFRAMKELADGKLAAFDALLGSTTVAPADAGARVSSVIRTRSTFIG